MCQKSCQHSGKITEAIYLEISEKTEVARKQDRRVSVFGMLKYLGVSRSGYCSWLKYPPTHTQKRREYIKARIKDIYDGSKQNYGAPKITRKLRQKGETISERTVGKYMKEMGIRAQWVRPWMITTTDFDLSHELQNILDEHSHWNVPMRYGATISRISGQPMILSI